MDRRALRFRSTFLPIKNVPCTIKRQCGHHGAAHARARSRRARVAGRAPAPLLRRSTARVARRSVRVASGLRPVRMPVRLLRLVAARNVSRDFRSFRIRHACCGQRPLRAGVSGDRPFCAATARAARQSVRHPDLHAPMSSASASLSALSTFHSFVAFAFSCFASQSGTGCPALRAMRMRAGAHSLS